MPGEWGSLWGQSWRRSEWGHQEVFWADHAPVETPLLRAKNGHKIWEQPPCNSSVKPHMKTKNAGISYKLTWVIQIRAPIYLRGNSSCQLCLHEKTEIALCNSRMLLNSKTELLSKCIHKGRLELDKVNKNCTNPSWRGIFRFFCTIATFGMRGFSLDFVNLIREKDVTIPIFVNVCSLDWGSSTCLHVTWNLRYQVVEI